MTIEPDLRLEIGDGSVRDGSRKNREVALHEGCQPVGRELIFDGFAEAFLRIPEVTLGAPAGLTIHAWIFLDSVTSRVSIVDFGSGASSDNVVLAIGASGRLLLEVRVGNGLHAVESAAPVNVRSWTHVAAVVDGDGSPSLYLDGQQVATTVDGSGFAPVPSGSRSSNFIGRGHSEQEHRFSGRLRSLRVYNAVLSEDQLVGDMIDDSGDDAAAPRPATGFPVDFDVQNGQHGAALFSMGDGQVLDVRVINASRTDWTLRRSDDAVSARNHHVALRFAPGTLRNDEEVRLSASAAQEWAMSHATSADGAAWFHLLRLSTEVVRPAGAAAPIQLENVRGDARGGSHGSVVSLTYHVYGRSGLLQGSRELHLGVIHQFPVNLTDLDRVLAAAPSAERISEAIIELRDQVEPPLVIETIDGWDRALLNGTTKLRLLVSKNPAYAGSGGVGLAPGSRLLLSSSDPGATVTVEADGGTDSVWVPIDEGELPDASGGGLEASADAHLPVEFTATVTDTGKRLARMSAVRLQCEGVVLREPAVSGVDSVGDTRTEVPRFTLRLPLKFGALRVDAQGRGRDLAGSGTFTLHAAGGASSVQLLSVGDSGEKPDRTAGFAFRTQLRGEDVEALRISPAGVLSGTGRLFLQATEKASGSGMAEIHAGDLYDDGHSRPTTDTSVGLRFHTQHAGVPVDAHFIDSEGWHGPYRGTGLLTLHASEGREKSGTVRFIASGGGGASVGFAFETQQGGTTKPALRIDPDGWVSARMRTTDLVVESRDPAGRPAAGQARIAAYNHDDRLREVDVGLDFMTLHRRGLRLGLRIWPDGTVETGDHKVIRIVVSDHLQIGTRWRLHGGPDAEGYSDEWLRLHGVPTTAGGKGKTAGSGEYYGGLAAGRLWSRTHSVESDSRGKQAISPLESSLDKVRRLEGVSYAWSSDPGGDRHLGFLAQAVQEVFPEVVVTGPDGVLGLEQVGLLAPVVQAIRELSDKVDALERGSS